MSERYTRLFTLSGNLYTKTSPVIIVAGVLLKDTKTEKILAQLKFRSISSKNIKSLRVVLHLKDTAGHPLGEMIEYQYLDISISRNVEFGQKAPIFLPNNTVRAFMAEVKSVVFSDNSEWIAPHAQWIQLPSPTPLTSVIKDKDLYKQYQIKYGTNSVVQYQPIIDLWYCTCGAINRTEEHICHHCRKSASEWAAVDWDQLNGEKELRLTKELQKENDAKEAEKYRKKRIKLVAIITLILAIVSISVWFATEKIRTYNKGLEAIKANRYTDAAAIFDALGDYKDSVDQYSYAMYSHAQNLVSNNCFEEAIAVFETLGDYKDSAEQRSYAMYSHAQNLVKNSCFEEAIAIFEALGDYKDSENQRSCAILLQAMRLLDDGKDEDAIALIKPLKEWPKELRHLQEHWYLSAIRDCTMLRLYNELPIPDVPKNRAEADAYRNRAKGIFELLSNFNYKDSADRLAKLD